MTIVNPDKASLGPSLGGLAEGVFDGLVREVILVSPYRTQTVVDIAEETGARLVKAQGTQAHMLSAGQRIALGDWCLLLTAGTVLQQGWTGAVREHLQHRPGQRAAFKLSGSGGFRASVATRLLGTPLQAQGILEPRKLTSVRPVAMMEPAAVLV